MTKTYDDLLEEIALLKEQIEEEGLKHLEQIQRLVTHEKALKKALEKAEQEREQAVRFAEILKNCRSV